MYLHILSLISVLLFASLSPSECTVVGASQPIQLRNSTLCFTLLSLSMVNESSLMQACSLSCIQLRSCLLSANHRRFPLLCDGRLIISDLIYSHQHLPAFPLLKSASFGASLIISKSVIKNIPILQSAGTLLSSGLLSSQQVSCCHFSNITMTASTFDCGIGQAQPNLLVGTSECAGCITENTESPFYGCVFPSITTHIHSDAVFLNSTFATCYRNIKPIHSYLTHRNASSFERNSLTVYENESFTSTRQLSSGTSYLFLSCNFTSCSTSGDGGGIYFSGSSSDNCTLIQCIFSSCSASSWGAAFYIGSISRFFGEACTSTNCSAWGGSAGFLLNIRTCHILRYCTASSCTGSYSGGYYLQGSNNTASSCEAYSNGCVCGCIFTNCNGSQHGGALRMWLNDVETVRNCSFISCTAKYGAGIDWVNPVDSQYDRTTWFYECIFYNNTASTSGHDAYFEADQPGVTIFDDYSYTLSNKTNRVFFNTESTSADSMLPYVSNPTIYVQTDENPEIQNIDSKCLHPSLSSCMTLSSAFTASKTWSSSNHKILVVDGSCSSDTAGVSVGTHNLTLSSTDDSSTIRVTSKHTSDWYFFHVNGGTLDVSYLTFSLEKSMSGSSNLFYIYQTGTTSFSYISVKSSSNYSFEEHIIYQSAGTFSLTHSSFSNIKMGTGRIRQLIHATCSSTISDCNFTNINRTSYNGSVFTFSNPDLNRISNISFNNCSTPSGYGGAMTLSISDGDSFSFRTVSFTGCSAGYSGGGVYLSITNSFASLSFSRVRFSSCSAGDLGNMMCIYTTLTDYEPENFDWSNLVEYNSISTNDMVEVEDVDDTVIIIDFISVFGPSSSSTSASSTTGGSTGSSAGSTSASSTTSSSTTSASSTTGGSTSASSSQNSTDSGQGGGGEDDSTSSAASTQSSSDSSSTKTAIIIVIVIIFVVILLIVVAVIVIYCLCKRKHSADDSEKESLVGSSLNADYGTNGGNNEEDIEVYERAAQESSTQAALLAMDGEREYSKALLYAYDKKSLWTNDKFCLILFFLLFLFSIIILFYSLAKGDIDSILHPKKSNSLFASPSFPCLSFCLPLPFSILQ